MAGLSCGLISVAIESVIEDFVGVKYYVYLVLLNIFITIVEVNAM